MPQSRPRPNLVGKFIREKREAAGLSQRALGLSFNPPVTTQFISNLERGVTPLPLNHVSTLTKALGVEEDELMLQLEQEYMLKLSGRLGHPDGVSDPSFSGGLLSIRSEDIKFMQGLYDAYRNADSKTRREFVSVCESLLHLPQRK